MARTGLPGKRKGFRAYLYTELEAHHVVFLKVFFSFLQVEFSSVPQFVGWLCRLLADHVLVDFAVLPEEQQKKLVVKYEMLHVVWIQMRCRQGVEKILKDADAAGGIPLRGMELKLRLRETTSGRKVFGFSLERPDMLDHRALAGYLLSRFRFCLIHLGRDAILKCGQCQSYFLRSDQRQARYCSPPCRFRAYHHRLTNGEDVGGKRQKRG